MKDIITAYTGKVTLLAKKNNKTFRIPKKNIGTNILFKNIINFLCGNIKNKDVSAYKINQMQVVDNAGSALSSPIIAITSIISDNQILCESVLYRDNLIGTGAGLSSIYLSLRNAQNEVLAKVDLSAEIASLYASEYDEILIKWEMLFNNKEEVTK